MHDPCVDYLHSLLEAVSLASEALAVDSTKWGYGDIKDTAIGWVVALLFDSMNSICRPEDTITRMDSRYRYH